MTVIIYEKKILKLVSQLFLLVRLYLTIPQFPASTCCQPAGSAVFTREAS